MSDTKTGRKRSDWLLFLLILLFGISILLLVGQIAIRIAPSLRVDADMRSNQNPDEAFLTQRASGEVFEPVRADIPDIINIFLTPNATLPPQVDIAAATEPAATEPATVAVVESPPATDATLVVVNPPLPPHPPPPPPPPPPPSSPSIDLIITKADDGVGTYTPGNSVTYTITVFNAGPANVTGATVTDTFPAEVASTTWTCAGAGGATCTAIGVTKNINDIVNIPVGSSVTYTAIATTASSATGNLVNTASVTAPAGYTDTNSGNNSMPDTDTPVFISNLEITKTDNSTDYIASATKIYTIVVSNTGPSDVMGATVNDTFPPVQIASASWSCAGAKGGICTAGPVNDNINDSVYLPVDASVTYTVTAIMGAELVVTNTASVTVPATHDPVAGNKSATDTDTLLVSSGTSFGNIGTTKDLSVEPIPKGSVITLTLSSPITLPHAGIDLIYYEEPYGSGILMDVVILEISDGSNWRPIFNWGDDIADTNTIYPPTYSMSISTLGGLETDNRDFSTNPGGILYNSTGITIQLDGVVPNGTYSYIRITAPTSGDVDGNVGIDGIYVFP